MKCFPCLLASLFSNVVTFHILIQDILDCSFKLQIVFSAFGGLVADVVVVDDADDVDDDDEDDDD